MLIWKNASKEILQRKFYQKSHLSIKNLKKYMKFKNGNSQKDLKSYALCKWNCCVHISHYITGPLGCVKTGQNTLLKHTAVKNCTYIIYWYNNLIKGILDVLKLILGGTRAGIFIINIFKIQCIKIWTRQSINQPASSRGLHVFKFSSLNSI